MKRKHPPISIHPTIHGLISYHQTLNGIAQVNWKEEYQDEYNCPQCSQTISKYYSHAQSLHQLRLSCKFCSFDRSLSCRIPIHIYNYIDSLECPNPLCNQIGRNGKKGWVYKKELKKKEQYGCHFCGIAFNLNSLDN